MHARATADVLLLQQPVAWTLMWCCLAAGLLRQRGPRDCLALLLPAGPEGLPGARRQLQPCSVRVLQAGGPWPLQRSLPRVLIPSHGVQPTAAPPCSLFKLCWWKRAEAEVI